MGVPPKATRSLPVFLYVCLSVYEPLPPSSTGTWSHLSSLRLVLHLGFSSIPLLLSSSYAGRQLDQIKTRIHFLTGLRVWTCVLCSDIFAAHSAKDCDDLVLSFFPLTWGLPRLALPPCSPWAPAPLSGIGPVQNRPGQQIPNQAVVLGKSLEPFLGADAAGGEVVLTCHVIVISPSPCPTERCVKSGTGDWQGRGSLVT